MTIEVSFELNGFGVEIDVEAHLRLLDLLRDVLGETGTKEACGEGECGACTVLIDGRAVNSCLFPVGEVGGTAVTTIEGLSVQGGLPSSIQKAFLDHGGTQCGFCAPGMIMTTAALLTENPHPTESEIRRALMGNLCRCTGYYQIVEAIQEAARVGQVARS
ncbi:MAG: (2Fe-2S)-binding protein [Acidimicrobiia bacterium]